MLGWLADSFRFTWGLLYWNTRKSWFQMRKGRARCPCQSPSDSGRAYETICEAAISWHNPARFRKVCPLLVQTPGGLRCSVNTPEVRPFWGRAFGYYGGTIAGVYLVGALTVFTFLRAVGYPVNIFHVTWPGSWHRLGQARGWFFKERANRAFAAGHTAEGMLYLQNAYEFDPGDYTIALSLAKNLQLGQATLSDQIYAQAMQLHPVQRAATAQEWFRALLPRGDFAQIEKLAYAEVLDDTAHASVWMRALLFASRQLNDDRPLRSLLASDAPAAAAWHRLAQAELLYRTNRKDAAHAALLRAWPDSPPYNLYYQVTTLGDLGDSFTALDLIGRYRTKLDDEARVTAQLDIYAESGAGRLVVQQAGALLNLSPILPVTKILAAHLIRHPNQDVLDLVFARFMQAKLPVNSDTTGIYLSLYCAAGVGQDWNKLHLIADEVKRKTANDYVMLTLAESFFRGDTTHTRIAPILPSLPLPLEVNYALLERYPGPARSPASTNDAAPAKP